MSPRTSAPCWCDWTRAVVAYVPRSVDRPINQAGPEPTYLVPDPTRPQPWVAPHETPCFSPSSLLVEYPARDFVSSPRVESPGRCVVLEHPSRNKACFLCHPL